MVRTCFSFLFWIIESTAQQAFIHYYVESLGNKQACTLIGSSLADYQPKSWGFVEKSYLMVEKFEQITENTGVFLFVRVFTDYLDKLKQLDLFLFFYLNVQ